MTLTTFPKVEQGTEAWHDLRRGIVTASVVGKLLTPTRKVADNDVSRGLTTVLAAERITGWTEDTAMTSDMYRGVECEPFARDAYAEHHAPVAEVGFMRREEDGWTLGYSPDGLVGDDGLIEIKSPRAKTHLRTILADEVPAHYMAQCQAGLLVSGRKWLDFVSYVGGMPLYVKRVEPNAEWQQAIADAVPHLRGQRRRNRRQLPERVTGLPDHRTHRLQRPRTGVLTWTSQARSHPRATNSTSPTSTAQRRRCSPSPMLARTVRLADQQPVNITLAEFPRVWRPAKGMLRVLADNWGKDINVWVGRQVELYGDPNVYFGKEKRGGTRISRLSHIDSRKTTLVNPRGGKGAYWSVDPLPAPKPEPTPAELAAQVAAALADATTEAEVKEWGNRAHARGLLDLTPEGATGTVRELVTARLAELSTDAETDETDLLGGAQ